MIDFSVNMSHVITLLSMVGGGFYFIFRMETNLRIIAENHKSFLSEIKDIKKDIEGIESKVENHGLALVKLSNQEDRLVVMDQRMNVISQRIDSLVVTHPKVRRRG